MSKIIRFVFRPNKKILVFCPDPLFFFISLWMDSNRFIGNIMDTKVLKPSFTALVKDFTLGLQNVFDNENKVLTTLLRIHPFL